MNPLNTEQLNTEVTNELNANVVHIYVKQRNGKKSITTIQGVDKLACNMESVLKDLKNSNSCGGSIVKNENNEKSEKSDKQEKQDKQDNGLIIVLQGDHRKEIQEYLIKKKLIALENIKVHG